MHKLSRVVGVSGRRAKAVEYAPDGGRAHEQWATKTSGVVGRAGVSPPAFGGQGPDIELSGLTVVFERASRGVVQAVADVSLTVPYGEFVCMIGRSGEGKTTLLNVIAGLVKPTQGTVLMGGRKIEGPGADRGLIFQADSVFPWMRVRANVEFGLRVRGVPKQDRKRITDEYLEAVGLSHVANSWPRELSGGMRARVSVAGVFANDPTVLLADEPFGALDYLTRRGLQVLLLRLWAQTGKTVIFVTHDVDEAILLADRILVVGGGRIVLDEMVTLTRPRTEDVMESSEAGALRRLLFDCLGLKDGPAGLGRAMDP